MKTIILTIAGSALIALSAVQFAAASEQHHVRHHHRTISQFRNSSASVAVAPTYEAAPSYSAGWSAPAGR